MTVDVAEQLGEAPNPVVEQLVDRDGLPLGLQRPRLDPAHREQVLDEPIESFGLVGDQFEQILSRRLRRRRPRHGGPTRPRGSPRGACAGRATPIAGAQHAARRPPRVPASRPPAGPARPASPRWRATALPPLPCAERRRAAVRPSRATSVATIRATSGEHDERDELVDGVDLERPVRLEEDEVERAGGEHGDRQARGTATDQRGDDARQHENQAGRGRRDVVAERAAATAGRDEHSARLPTTPPRSRRIDGLVPRSTSSKSAAWTQRTSKEPSPSRVKPASRRTCRFDEPCYDRLSEEGVRARASATSPPALGPLAAMSVLSPLRDQPLGTGVVVLVLVAIIVACGGARRAGGGAAATMSAALSFDFLFVPPYRDLKLGSAEELWPVGAADRIRSVGSSSVVRRTWR